MRAMKNSGIEWIGEIPESWETTRHKYVMHKEKNICEHYNGEDIISLTINGVIVRDLDAGGKMPTTFDGYQYVEPNKLLLCLFDIDVTPRCVGVIRNYGLTSPAYSKFVVHDGYHIEYYDYLLRAIDDDKVLVHLAKNLRSSFTETDFGALPTVVPPYPEQQAISTYLDRQCAHIDNIIEKTKASIEEYKKLRQAVITQAVTINGTPYKISHIGELKNGLNYHATETKHIIKILGVGDFKDFLVLNAMEQFSDLPIEDEIANEFLLKNGDIIFVRSNGSKELVGRSIMVDNIDFPLTYSGFCIRFRNIRTDIADNKYLLYFFRSYEFREALQYQCFGTNISNLSQDMISSVKIMLPPIKKQQEIAAYLDQKCAEIDALITKKEQFLTELESYKKSMIYEYVTGKKEVPQA